MHNRHQFIKITTLDLLSAQLYVRPSKNRPNFIVIFKVLFIFLLIIYTTSNLFAKLTPIDLKCDYFNTPIAVEKEIPHFFWKSTGSARGTAQTAYQIQVALSPATLIKASSLLWDSQKQTLRKSIHIPYQGPKLTPMTKVYWHVRIWDENDKPSEWSESTWFQTGLMNEKNWKGARWISCTRPETAPQYPPDHVMGPWIKSVNKQKGKGQISFQYEFNLPDKPIVSAWTYWGSSTKDHCFVSVNDQSSRFHQRGRPVLRGDYSFVLKKGQNQLKINFSKNANSDISVSVGMHIVFVDGTDIIIHSSDKWKYISDKGVQGDVKISSEYNKPPYNKAVIYHIKPLPATWYKRSFQIPKKINSAMLYVSSGGFFEVYVNGQKAGDHVLDPGQSDYEAFSYYQTFNVTKNIKQNANVISILLGDGWYNQDRGFLRSNLRYGKPTVRAVLYVNYSDGTKKALITDKTWAWKESEIRLSNIYLGEEVDFRLQHDEWASTDKQPGWKKTTAIKNVTPNMMAQDFEPIRKIRALKPVKLWQIGKKTWIADFGQNISGWVRLRFKENKDSIIRIRVTEQLTKDRKYLENTPQTFWKCHGSPQYHTLIADGKEHTWEPRFNYHGFQFAEIHGLTKQPKPKDFTAIVVHTDSPRAAEFNSSDPLLNRIFKMGLQTHYNNMHSILEDCPQREKCLWGGDLHASWATGFLGIESAPFYRQQIRVYYTGNFSEFGIPGNIGVGKRSTQNIGDFSWGVSPLFITWWMYQVYGDLEPARIHFNEIKNYLQYFEGKSPDLIPHLHKHSDHARPFNHANADNQNKPLIAALNFYAGADRFSKLAEALNRKEDAVWGQELASRIKKSIQIKFYDKKNHTYGNGTQNSLALAFKMVDKNNESSVHKSLAKIYQENGKQFDGGFMSYWIYPMLSRNGYVDLAYEMLINPDYPGIAWSIKKFNATSIIERYFYDMKVMKDRSWAHHAMNHPTAWMLTDLAGIRIDPSKPGFQDFILMPHVPKGLQFVDGSINTLYGTIKSSWKQNKNSLEWNITIPANTTSKIYIPVQDNQKIMENGKIVENSQDLTYIGSGNKRKIYKAVSGNYKFHIK